MSTQPAAVEMGGMHIESNSASTDEIIAAVTPREDEAPKARAVKPKDEADEAPKSDLSKAASELGKAAAKARAAKGKDVEGADEKVEAKPKAGKVEETADESDDEDETEPGKKAKPGNGSDLREQIKEKARHAAEAKRELALERAERQRLAAELAELRKPAAKPVEQKQAAAPNKPKASDFEDYGDYVIAAAEYVADQKHAAREQQTTERQQTQKVEQDIHEWKSQFSRRVSKAVESDPDFASRLAPEVVALKPVYNAIQDKEPVTALNFVADEIVGSEHAAALMVYLTEHPQELQRLATLRTPHDVVREMAKVEAKLDSSSDAASTGSGIKSGASKAKPPVKPVTGSPSVGSDDDDLNDDAPLSARVRRFGQWQQKGR